MQESLAPSHTAWGGVYRAVDQQTGARVVIKQARAHILGLHHIGDARDGLRHEARMLDELAGLAPAVHQRGLVFRDLTPGNVMMLEDGQLRLIDTEAVTRPGTWVTQVPGIRLIACTTSWLTIPVKTKSKAA